jgi:deoxyhypusine synthase
MKIRDFLRHHYRHFNAATVVEAAEAYRRQLDSGGKMMVTIAGAMSTAEIGLSLAEMIRQGKVHAICCTGANLEEDLFNLVAHDHYHRVPDWRNLTPEEEKDLESRGLNRVTDTCIPEEEAFKTIEDPILELWQKAGRAGERLFPHEYLFQLLNEGTLADRYQVDPTDSWMVAAAERNLPLFVPGWEDSSLANVFVARVLDGKVSSFEVVKSGLEYMAELVDWYARQTMGRGIDELEQHPEGPPGVRTVHERALRPEDAAGGVGFFQIGGGIAAEGLSLLVLLLSDLGLDHQLRLVLGGFPHREDHLGEARRRHAEVPDRVRRHDRGPTHLRPRAGLVGGRGSRKLTHGFRSCYPRPALFMTARTDCGKRP